MKRTIEINVLSGFDGFSGELVDRIRRVPTLLMRKDNRGRRRSLDRPMFVSYKGERRRVFVLPLVFGEIAGYCISLEPRS